MRLKRSRLRLKNELEMAIPENLNDIRSLRKRVAREAAFLIYTSQEKEYKQAKRKAAEILGARILPSNREVANELDAIADEIEGKSRLKRLLRMRKEALEIMQCLEDYSPRLIGSVWRGTVHKNSDIDITVFSHDPKDVMKRIAERNFKIIKVEEDVIAEGEDKRSTFHIHIILPSGDEAEVVVRDPKDKMRDEICEIYGDVIRGLSLNDLRKILESDPYKRFVPE